ncbi:hypothetical protein ABIE89_000248 [Bradyrhizobium niftali]|uniref:hypothetical protein n=1 Tax=Bradyrhizobium niftali TaxID=2560055 RepID=UPI00383487BA
MNFMMRIRRLVDSETLLRYRTLFRLLFMHGRRGTAIDAKDIQLVTSCVFVLRPRFDRIYHSASNAKPFLIGFPVYMEPVETFLGAKRGSPPVVADQPKLAAAYRTAPR